MYIAPIEMETTIRDITGKITENTDKAIMEAVFSVGIKVNRYELMKALAYDRKQSNRGIMTVKPTQGARGGGWL